MAVYRGDNLVATYTVNCDASEAARPAELDPEGERSQIAFVAPASHPEGLLIVACRAGAHSKELSVFDPNVPRTAALWSHTGSYYAGWQMTGTNQLMLFYDQPCNHTACVGRFEPVEVMWRDVKKASQ